MNIAVLNAQHCLITLITIRPIIRMTRKSGFVSGDEELLNSFSSSILMQAILSWHVDRRHPDPENI